ncbi:UDP-4-amino-4,6-dideoxy-N-acetyl-beta-L-altrosamine transaminase [Salidesulfovibrio onnuriiensis]|uniref:UDP-4-amino-4, 6-dideoxy-N-acetyl-beta-L-altrosamine transaminase n=1 Tax=Salidesulfovibrio onnuriiensis TaxID=2583823 RepID=UPI0011CA1657|nr:UDP-4-amino-4,6-dideoxy-N-acetyl-beta-L-altrosamine transaminase [Salidesulfovibrio onnuriiensis]
MIPYGKQHIDEDDIRIVTQVLRSDWLTCGQMVPDFENALAKVCQAEHCVAVSSGTAALHAAMAALGIGKDDEVIVPSITFAATANAVTYCGGTPVFADVEEDTLLLSPEGAEKAITPRTKAIVGVDYAGQPCDWSSLRALADKHGLALVADSCHALGATCEGRPVNAFADMTVYSFHPVKHIATGEGGAIATDSLEYANFMRRFRNHGISSDARMRESAGTWYYEMVELGYNYRLTDIQCALGLSQLNKLDSFLKRRRSIASKYDKAFAEGPVRPLQVKPNRTHAYHLYVVRVPERDTLFAELREAGIGVQVHYIPVHLHPFYRKNFGTGRGLCPVAEAAYEQIVSIPMFPALQDAQIQTVVDTFSELLKNK